GDHRLSPRRARRAGRDPRRGLSRGPLPARQSDGPAGRHHRAAHVLLCHRAHPRQARAGGRDRRGRHQNGRGDRPYPATCARAARRKTCMRPFFVLAVTLSLAACHRGADAPPTRASGYVEATDVRLAPEVGGRLLEVKVAEGDRVAAGDLVARIDTADAELSLRRAQADRDQAQAQLALLLAGSRPEDVRQAAAQLQAAQADVKAAQADADAAAADLRRFEDLLRANAGSVKQRDDAATRRDVAVGRARGAAGRAPARAPPPPPPPPPPP